MLTIVVFSCTHKYPLNLGEGYVLDYGSNDYIYISNSERTVMIGDHVELNPAEAG